MNVPTEAQDLDTALDLLRNALGSLNCLLHDTTESDREFSLAFYERALPQFRKLAERKWAYRQTIDWQADAS